MTRSTPLNELSTRSNTTPQPKSQQPPQQPQQTNLPPAPPTQSSCKPSPLFYDSDPEIELVEKDIDYDIETLIENKDERGIKNLQDQIEYLKNEINETKKSGDTLAHRDDRLSATPIAIESSHKTIESDSGLINVKNIELLVNCLHSIDYKKYLLIFILNLFVYSNHINDFLVGKLEETSYMQYLFLIKALSSVFFVVIFSKLF